MGLSLLAGAGRLLWPLLGTLVPIGNPQATKALLILLLGVVAIGAPAGAVWLSMRGEIKAAVAARDLHWQSQIQKANETHERNLQAAAWAADTVPATPADRAERLRVCQQSPTCRERRR